MKQQIHLNDKTAMDLPRLIPSKLFIYANSGYGKSFLERRIAEQASGKIQQIIIDPEGEFSTLREKYDFLLVGKGKDFDIQADPRTAALLAHRLLEEKVSVIIDLYELEPEDRDKFVANFSKALINAPKNLWHPYLYLVDEAQDFAPEKGNTLSYGPLLSIAKKGRKRGCCPIFATQRVADFSKSVIAACNNKLIGQASLDIDMKRCAAELGFTTKEQMLALRDLEPGEFYAFGPAISKTIQKIKIGPVSTSHPDSSKIGGKIGTKVVPASEKVKKALARLADLPQEAQEEANTIAGFKLSLSQAKREIMELKKMTPKQDPDAFKRISEKAFDLGVESGKTQAARREIAWQKKIAEANKEISKLGKIIVDINKMSGHHDIPVISGPDIVLSHGENHITPYVKIDPEIFNEMKLKVDEQEVKQWVGSEGTSEQKPLSKGARTVLSYLRSVYPAWKTKAQCWVAAGYAPGGGFNNLIYELTGVNLIEKDRTNSFCALPPVDEESFDSSLDKWKSKLSTGAAKVFTYLLDMPDTPRSKEEMAQETGYALGGGFNNLVYELTGKELVIRQGNSYMINPVMLDL